MAANYALSGHGSGSVIIKRVPEAKIYIIDTDIVPLGEVAGGTKKFPQEFIAPCGTDVTKEFVNYALPLVGELPVMARLKEIG
ncbi:Pyrophosphate--fructose 6-phosphate 1-phosphotransferase [uncultured archaeon]|nr:Pyrophosphate--fructose 6-phosphate 1-phosphotransferase [uncultured archaeon]